MKRTLTPSDEGAGVALTVHLFTDDQLRAIFAEWERWYREDPETFSTAAEQATWPLETYGDISAATFLGIADRLA